jgi:predicted small secreted protein
MKNLTRTLLAIAALGFALGSLTGCNTVEGAGKDVKKVGEVIEETADDA